jgi:catechol 2,3-dioxygenase-like lactoylglutathione lyase family enzyme
MRFNHVALSVADLDRSIAFYREHFGMEKMVEPFPFEGQWYADIMALDKPEGRMTMIGRNGMALELFEFHNPDQGEQDVNDEAYERMLAAGVRFHCPVLTFGTTTKAFYARDPDGNVFEVVENLQKA